MAAVKSVRWAISAALAAAVILASARALAHCDGLDGPVVKAARLALETRNPALVLIWVQPNDEGEIRTAFERALAVRELSPQAKDLADQFFFETLVRVHRAGEGAPFTGLKAAGRDLGPAIPAADRALETGSVEPVMQLLTRARGLFPDVQGELVPACSHDMCFTQRRIVDARVLDFLKKTRAADRGAITERSVA